MTTILVNHKDTKRISVASSSEKLSNFSTDNNGDIPSLGMPVDAKAFGFLSLWRQDKKDLDAVATQPSVFDDPTTLEIYRPPPQYENTHRFDPLARWTWREEKRVLRKIDIRIMLWAFIMFFSLELDRSNLSQANADNILNDLGLSTNDFNLGNILFRLSFLLAGIL
uniref:Uncharacterized protein n=1 Tax=Psilocybe cubensis TaxID=181762 RepID=A0A8H8CQE0_PSICU